MSEEQPPTDPGQRGSDLSDLRSRLAALHGSVERLGREDDRPDDEAVAPEGPYGAGQAPPAQAPYDYAPPPAAPSEAAPPQPLPDDAYELPPAPAPQGYYDPYQAPPPPAPPPEGAYLYADALPVSEPYPPAPAATNGLGSYDPGVIAANVAILDIGPFADLIELRHFEEAVARLEVVVDVRVRRFGHGRAIIELGLAGPYAVGRELYRLGRPMQVEPGLDGELIVDFTDIPDLAPETEAAPGTGTESETNPEDPDPANSSAEGNEDV